MQIKVNEIDKKAVIEFDHSDYIICESDDKVLGDYTLNHRIYLDYKDDVQVGMPVMYISEKEANKLESILDRAY